MKKFKKETLKSHINSHKWIVADNIYISGHADGIRESDMTEEKANAILLYQIKQKSRLNQGQVLTDNEKVQRMVEMASEIYQISKDLYLISYPNDKRYYDLLLEV